MTKATLNFTLLKKLLSETPEILSQRLEAEKIVMTNEERFPEKANFDKKLLPFVSLLSPIKEETQADIENEGYVENIDLDARSVLPDSSYVEKHDFTKESTSIKDAFMRFLENGVRTDDYSKPSTLLTPDFYSEPEPPISPRKTGAVGLGPGSGLGDLF